MLSFQALSEEEVLNLLKPGEYSFEVRNAVNTISKSNNPMIKLTLRIWDDRGGERQVIDYLMPTLMYKLRHFCYAVGLEKKYEEQKLDAFDCIGKSGKCKLKIEESEGYAPKNTVQDYIKKTSQVSTNEVKEDFKSDDIPF